MFIHMGLWGLPSRSRPNNNHISQQNYYLPYTILLELPFCISACSEIPPAKYDILHSKSLKMCHKNFENRLTNMNYKPKNDIDLVFCMYKGSNPKVFKS